MTSRIEKLEAGITEARDGQSGISDGIANLEKEVVSNIEKLHE